MDDPAQHTFNRLFGPEFGHGKAFDLGRLRRALTALGDPHTKLPRAVHVAGTNGKGSTIAFMRAIAEAAGLRVHAFTKPHLFALNERFVVGGETAADEALIAAAERVAAADTALAHFDAQVAAAFLLFSERPADLVLLETGMGGRDDSTNVLETPAATLITPIGLDHQDVLGQTRAEIAAHKAGILKRGAPAFVAAQDEESRVVIETAAERVGAPLFLQGAQWDAYASGGRLMVQTETRLFDLAPPALRGPHQITNAGLAVAALSHVIDLSDEQAEAGVRGARWPGRLQPLTRGPFSMKVRERGGEVWIDGGHNAHAAAALARAMETMNRRRDLPLIVMCGVRARKDAPAIVAQLAPRATMFFALPLEDDVGLAKRIASFALEFGARDAQVARDLNSAMQRAGRPLAQPARVLICGSFLLAAEALRRENA